MPLGRSQLPSSHSPRPHLSVVSPRQRRHREDPVDAQESPAVASLISTLGYQCLPTSIRRQLSYFVERDGPGPTLETAPPLPSTGALPPRRRRWHVASHDGRQHSTTTTTGRGSCRSLTPSGVHNASQHLHPVVYCVCTPYLLTPGSPQGIFHHRNRARTVHTLHKGRGRY